MFFSNYSLSKGAAGTATMSLSRDKMLEVDIHKLSVRVMRLYSVYQTNCRGMSLLGVERNVKYPSNKEDLVTPAYIPDFFKIGDKTTVFKMATAGFPSVQTSEDTFFSTGANRPADRHIQEDIFWAVVLQYSCSALTIAIRKIADALGKNKLYSWLPVADTGLKKTYLEPASIGILQVLFHPTELHVIIRPVSPISKENMILPTEGIGPVKPFAFHESILLANQYVLDCSAMQFGQRGAKRELVGRVSHREDYLRSFKGNVKQSIQKDLFKNYAMNQGIVDPIVMQLLMEIENGTEWCSYCGKTDDLKLCIRCKSVFYCDKHCQMSDWGGHKPMCTELLTVAALPVMKK